jgi:hypothetical protein
LGDCFLWAVFQYISSPHYRTALFPRLCINFGKKWIGLHFGRDFPKTSTGHPAHQPPFFSLSRDKESFQLIFLLLFGDSQVSTSFQLSSRVTVFGKFLPFGRLFTFSNFLI